MANSTPAHPAAASTATPLPPAPLPNTTAALRERHGPRYRWWVLLTVMLGSMAAIMSSTIVNVAVPDMSRAFTLGQERAQWMSAGFMAAMTLSMLTTPWLLSRFGYRVTYAGLCALLMLGGIGGGLGQTYEWVIAMRVIEGLAAGIMQPIPAIIILRAFGPHEQGRAMGVFGMGTVLAPALGPSVGGVLVDAFGWRSIFFVVVPFCIAALVCARRYLPHSAPGGVQVASTLPLDWRGLGLMTVFLLCLLNGMVALQSQNGAAHGAAAAAGAVPWIALVLLGLALGTLVAFIALQRRAPHPLLHLGLFRQRAFSAGGCVAFVYGMALFGSTYLVPVFMQLALNLPPSQAGAVLLPAGLALAATIPLAGAWADRLPIHALVLAGVLLMTLSFALMLAVGLGTALWVIGAFAVIGRIGLGFVVPSLNLGAMRGLQPALIPQGSSAINFLRQLGGAVGVNLIGIFLGWRLRAHGVQPGDARGSAGQLAAFHEAFGLLASLTAAAALAAWQMGVPARPATTPDAAGGAQ